MAGFQCLLVWRLHSPSSYRNLVWLGQHSLKGATGDGQPSSQPGPLLLPTPGYSGAPSGSGPEKKSVNRVRQDSRRWSERWGRWISDTDTSDSQAKCNCWTCMPGADVNKSRFSSKAGCASRMLKGGEREKKVANMNCRNTMTSLMLT